MIDGETGFVFEPRDVAGMSDAVSRLVADPELRHSMGAKGKSRVAAFDARVAFEELESEYRKRLEHQR